MRTPTRHPLLVGLAALLAVTALGCAAAKPQAPTEEPPPLLQLPADVRPLRYELEMEVVLTGDDFRGTIAIEVELSSPRRVIWLHAHDLRVGSAAIERPGDAPMAAAFEQVTSEGVAKLTLPRPMGPGRATLRMTWSGAWGDGQLEGLYRTGLAEDLHAVSHFESIYARRAFPCFDEPRFKTPFEVSLSVPSQGVAVSNGPLVDETPVGGGLKRARFAPTLPLPTYLLFLGAGPFDVVATTIPPNEVRPEPLSLRGLAPRGRGRELAFGLRVSADLVTALERWFALPFPYEKLDIVVATSTPWGGMENAGAILFRDSYFLLDEDRADEEQRRRIANLVAHEISHQWFGDLVTLPWWTDTWLNESFGEFFGGRMAHRYRPDWGLDLLEAGWVEEAMRTDELASARAIRQPLRRTEEIPDLFDALTYDKGHEVLLTFERWMGEESFRNGLRAYLAAHRHGTASVDDLLGALSRSAGRDIAAAFRTFVDQPGIPLVSTHVDCDERGARAEIAQRRYRPRGVDSPDLAWQVPVCLRLARGRVHEQRCSLVGPAGATLHLGSACPDWVFPDAGGTGYYRWALAAADLQRLRSGLAHLEPAERFSLARNLRAAQRAGALSFGGAMDALAALAADRDPEVAGAGMDAIDDAREFLLPDADRALAEEVGRSLYRPVLRGASGFDAPPGERDAERRLRVRAVTFLARVARDPEIRREAARRGLAYAGLVEGRFLAEAVSPDLAALALEVAVQEHGEELYDGLLGRLSAVSDGAQRKRILLALSAPERPPLSTRAAALWRDERVLPNERIFTLLLHQRPEKRRRAFEQVRGRLDEAAALVPTGFVSYLPQTASAFCDPARLEEARALFEPAVSRYPAMRLSTANVLERIRLCIAEREADGAAASAWFRAKAGGGASRRQ